MIGNSINRRAFYVVQFIDLPFKGIEDYLCVPYTWMVVRRAIDGKALVAYPNDEDPINTKDRVKKKERYDDEWGFYIATIKYESDSYEDAESWIMAKKDCGPFEGEESKIKDMPSRFTLNKKLRSANQSNSTEFNDNPRRPLPRISIKRPALSEPKKQLDGKRLKLEETGQSSSAVVNDTNAEPGCSKREQSMIIQDNQSMECAQTEETAAASNGESRSSQPTNENLQESLPMQEQHELNMPVIDVDTPTVAIDNDKKVQPTSIIKQQLFSIQVLSQFAEQTEPVQQPQISVAPSMRMTCNNHKLRTDHVLNTEPTSHHLPDSLKMSAHIYSQMNGARRLVPIQEPVEKRIHLMNITRNLGRAAQSPLNLMDQTGSSSTHSVTEQSSVVPQSQSQDSPRVLKSYTENRREQTAPIRSIAISFQDIQCVPKTNVGRSQDVAAVDPWSVHQSDTNVASSLQTLSSSSHKRRSLDRRLDGHQRLLAQEQYLKHAHQNQYLPINQDSFEQNLLNGSPESNINNHQSNPPTIRIRIPSMKQNLTHLSNPMHQTSELLQQRQPQPNQQDSQQQQQRPKIRVGISITPKSNRQISTLHGVAKKTPPPIFTKVLKSMQQTLSTTPNNYSRNEQQFQASQIESGLVSESHRNVIDNACQTDECMMEEPLSPYHAVTSDSDSVTDHEVVSDQEMSTDEALAFGSSSADRPTTAQNSTSPNDLTHPRFLLEQEMLDNFASLFTQMGTTLRYTCDMYHNLRSSILETAETYKNLLGAVERFNVVGDSTSNAFPSSNVTPEVPQATEERHIEVPARAHSSYEHQHSNNVADQASKNIHNNLWRFVLPPEYDPHDTRWTLKYRTNSPGLVELMPQSGIYVSYGELKYCQRVSKDCKSLAQRLLPEVFNRKALSVCLSMSEKAQASNNVGSNVRPELDQHASEVLLNFVLDYGLQCGWKTDLQPILSTLHSKIQEIRFRSGVMVQC